MFGFVSAHIHRMWLAGFGDRALAPRQHIDQPENDSRRPIATQIADGVQQGHVSAANSWITDFGEK